jgi:FkbM family methyltransferase
MKEMDFELSEGKVVKVRYEDDCHISTSNVLTGEYDVKDAGFVGRPVILDIGANIGEFAIWTLQRWNPSFIYCYEPLKKNFNQLYENISNLPEVNTEITLINKAVEAPSNKLYLGSKSMASSSFYDLNEQLQEFEEVESMSAESLPECHILKVDTEGCEVDIITKYLYSHNRPSLILFEYHRDTDRRILDDLLYTFNYRLCSGFLFGYELGVLKYATVNMLMTGKK